MSFNIIEKIAMLPSLKQDELKKLWIELFDSQPPRKKREYLIPRLAWKIQELNYGGLSNEDKNIIKKSIKNKTKLQTNDLRCKEKNLAIGTTIIRKYKGIEHHVTVTRTGFEYQGKSYRSLSAIALEITKTRWSGPLFFGIATEKKGNKK